jgi:hypothetical protein
MHLELIVLSLNLLIANLWLLSICLLLTLLFYLHRLCLNLLIKTNIICIFSLYLTSFHPTFLRSRTLSFRIQTLYYLLHLFNLDYFALYLFLFLL